VLVVKPKLRPSVNRRQLRQLTSSRSCTSDRSAISARGDGKSGLCNMRISCFTDMRYRTGFPNSPKAAKAARRSRQKFRCDLVEHLERVLCRIHPATVCCSSREIEHVDNMNIPAIRSRSLFLFFGFVPSLSCIQIYSRKSTTSHRSDAPSSCERENASACRRLEIAQGIY
jgi:hypothetical protein